MNPIIETRYGLVRYVVLWGLFAAAWAVVWGLASAMPADQAAICGAVFGAVTGFEGLLLWNVLKYGPVGTPTAGYVVTGMPTMKFWRLGRLATLVVVGALFTVVAVGAEVLALWGLAGALSAAAVATIPARALSAAAVYVCFVQWYRSASPYSPERPEPSEADPAPGSVETIERITVKGAGGRIEVIDLERIVCIEAEGDYVAIVTPDGRWLKEGTMKYFESALPRTRFVRVHRSCIVAVGHISRIETSGRDHYLILHSGDKRAGNRTIRISEAGYRVLKQTLGL